MTKDELLKPRYKVIAGYPQSFWSIGLIIEAFPVDHAENAFGKYPHLFKKLEWWEHRTIEQLKSVEYVKVTTHAGYWIVGDIVKVEKFVFEDGKPYGYDLQYKHFHPVTHVSPSDKSDYLEYQKQTEPKMKL